MAKADGSKSKLKDLALELGVSIITVSRALDPRRRHLLKPRTLELVLRKAEETGFVGNPSARRVRSGRCEVLSFIAPAFLSGDHQSFFNVNNRWLIDDTMIGATRKATEWGYDIKYLPFYTADQLVELDRSLGYPYSDGAILYFESSYSEKLYQKLADKGIPLVTVNGRRWPTDIPTVTINPDPGVFRMLDYFLAAGHRDIALICGYQSFRQYSDRYQSFRKYLEARNLFRDELCFGFFHENEVRKWLHGFNGKFPFTAVFCHNDVIAYTLLRELEWLGVKVPEQIAVVGYDQDPFISELELGLSTIVVPRQDLGARAVDYLIANIERGESLPGTELLNTRFIKKKTC